MRGRLPIAVDSKGSGISDFFVEGTQAKMPDFVVRLEDGEYFTVH